MDYIKAVKLINSFPNEDKLKIFNQIWDITRLYLPKILYKFYSITDNKKLNKLKIETLEDQKVLLSELSKFNDPYDGRAIFYNTNELKCFEFLKEGKLIDDFGSYHIGTSLTMATT